MTICLTYHVSNYIYKAETFQSLLFYLMIGQTSLIGVWRFEFIDPSYHFYGS